MDEPTKENSSAAMGSGLTASSEPSSAAATAGKMPTSTPKDTRDAPQASEAQETTVVPRKYDFGFLPIPKSRQYRPDRSFSPFLNYLFAIASTSTVANLYYCQPLLVRYSEDFGVTYGQATHVPTVLQAGYAGGLLLITPLGDILRRRQLVLLLVTVSTMLTIGLAVTKSFTAFLAINFFVGLTTVTPQVLIPLAGDLSPAKRRAQSMAIVLSGLLLGILVARLLAGVIAEFVPFRNVYYMAIGLQGFVGLSMYFGCPDYPPKNPDLKYWRVFPTMVRFLYTNPVLDQGALTSGICSASFISFWVTLTFLLSDAPYRYNTLTIGLFGLIGIVAVCTAPFCGKLVDRLVPWVAVVLGNCLLVLANVILLAAARKSIAVVVISIIIMDIGQQFQQVGNQTRIFSTNPAAGARLQSCYVIGIFVGQLIGSSALSKIYLDVGVRPFYAVNVGLIAANLLILMARGPLKSNTKWLGWGQKDEWALIKRREPKPDAEQSPSFDKLAKSDEPGASLNTSEARLEATKG